MSLMAVAMLLTACHSHKKTASDDIMTNSADTLTSKEFLQMVHTTSAAPAQYVTSKVKFTLDMGQQSLNFTGNLQMKRDDVIRLQLMAFGFVEAGRMEFTKDYVLIIDRINKQYIRVPYKYIDFLRNSGINFYTLQALFWNELFIPGEESLNTNHLRRFTTNMGGDEAAIYLDQGKIAYSWLANQKTGRIKMTNIMYRDPYDGNTQLNWNYVEYGQLNGKVFPDDMIVTLTSPKKEVSMHIKLNYLKVNDQWETRTTISDKYRQVNIDDLFKRVLSSF